MFKKILLAVALIMYSIPSYAQTPGQVIPGNVTTAGCPGITVPCFYPNSSSPPLGYQQLTSLATATSLTVPVGAVEALIVCEGQTVRWRDDGTAPTASVGMPLPVLTAYPYINTPAALAAFQIIQETASATCNISYYK